MLQSLSIKNFALIESLQMSFSNGFSIITGETGAGKSILLGALGLVLGKRADLSSLKDTNEKCVVEAQFAIKNYNLKPFFDQNDIDYDELTIIRREILPSGKSRAFINDSPVTVAQLSDLGTQLMDIHSQHQTLELSDEEFQLYILDAIANHGTILNDYKTELQAYKKIQTQLNQLIQQSENHKKEQEYNQFLFNELETAKLKAGEQKQLEQLLEELSNGELIRENLEKSLALSQDETVGIQTLLVELKGNMQRIKTFSPTFLQLNNRLESVVIELDDIVKEIFAAHEKLNPDPEQLALISQKLETIYTLQKKHKVTNVEELLDIQQQLSDKLNFVANLDSTLQDLQKQLNQKQEQLTKYTTQLTENRQQAALIFVEKLKYYTQMLGLENAEFQFIIQSSDKFLTNGNNTVELLFRANIGTQFGQLKRVASGGELSRIMLGVKAILAQYSQLPTLIFDEIDTGVSGEMALKMGQIMQQMSKTMQIFAITHLPQIAAKGQQHYRVQKSVFNDTTQTEIALLNPSERVTEIAQMLSGKNITDSALEHAKSLLQAN